jgi:hypothetical protein
VSLSELERVRRELAEAFRLERDTFVEPPQGFHSLLKHLEMRMRDVQREKAFAQVDASIAKLMQAVGR